MDDQLFSLIDQEVARQTKGLEMIPSENHTSGEVLRALGSRLSDKYAEGYAGKRYYGGCEVVDQVELLAIDRAKKLFGVSHVNVQPYSGSPANQAVFFALLEPGDKVMGLALTYGGHMTHGLKVNFSGKTYEAVNHHTTKDGFIDYEEMEKLAREQKPKMVIAGYTAYPRSVDWARIKKIAEINDSWLLADISHISGLVAAGVHASPVGIADVITSTTHKTLRGPRGAMIMCNGNVSNPLKKPEIVRSELPTLVDRAIIPGLQGGPHNHQTAAIAVALREADTPEFRKYAGQIVKNSKKLADCLMDLGFQLVTGGTDTHLMVADLTNKSVIGEDAERALSLAGITVNKNTVPFDPRSPFSPSGIRIGTPAVTTRGMKEADMEKIAHWIDRAVTSHDNTKTLESIHTEITDYLVDFPLPV
jgi:glycine hydroxymethyltransferase